MARLVILLFCVACLGAHGDVAGISSPQAPAGSVWGADISALPVFESHGAQYRDTGGAEDALLILRRAGMNCFRLRLFVAPNGEGIVTNDLSYTLALARRVKASGARLMLDLHFSDTWADPAKQFKPKAWENMPFERLVVAMREYTRSTLEAFFAAGVQPDYLQIGNEITNGLLWPDGRVEFKEAADVAAWERLGHLLGAAFEGVDAAVQGAKAVRPRTILHIESTGDVARTTWWLENAVKAKLPFDIVGLSYYPEWHGDIDALGKTLAAVANTFGKPVMVVETAYPWKRDAHWEGKQNLNWPLTPEGQRQFHNAVAQAVEATPKGLGAGVLWWHPESLPVHGLHTWVGGSCALFGADGRLLPAAKIFDAEPSPVR